MRAAILRRIPFCNKKGNFRNISYEKNSKVFSQNSRSYGEFYSVIADSYGNVPVMLYVMGFQSGISGGRCEELRSLYSNRKTYEIF